MRTKICGKCKYFHPVDDEGFLGKCKADVNIDVMVTAIDKDYCAKFNHAPIVKIKLLEQGCMPTLGTPFAAAFDLYASKDVCVDGFGVTRVPLGFALELPIGYKAIILPRSSIGLKTPLRMANSAGVIDCDYRGEVCALYECKEPFDEYDIKKGDRIAQMIIEVAERVILEECLQLSATDRGEGGFGSTGV